jgi:hypothetical protein
MESIIYSTALVFVLIVGLAFVLRLEIAKIERRLPQLKRLEAKIDLLLKHENLVYETVTGVPSDILEAVRAGDRVVRLYRILHNCSLKEAKEAIERVDAKR